MAVVTKVLTLLESELEPTLNRMGGKGSHYELVSVVKKGVDKATDELTLLCIFQQKL